MGDPAPIPIESQVTRETESTEARDGALGRTSSGRVVHEPGRWPRAAAIVAVVGLVAGGAVWALRDGETAPAAGEDDASEPSAPPDDRQAATRATFARAVLQFGEVDSFSYRGSVHTDGQHPFEPTPWTTGDATVSGSVLLLHGLSRDAAVDGNGGVVETLTSGTTVWRRTAPVARALEGASWEVRSPPGVLAGVAPGEVRTPTRFPLDAVTITRLVLAAGNPRGEAADGAGRRMIRATLPDRAAGGDRRPLGGADVLLTLDDRENVVRLVVTWPAADPHLLLDLEISRHDEPQDIALPDSGPAALRRTVPVDRLEAAGVRPLELGRVPAGWRLIGASPGPFALGPGDCSMLSLTYANPAAVGDYLWLQVTSAGCSRGFGDFSGRRQPLTVGRFEGSVVVSSARTIGALFDGTTAVRFETDLPVDDVATLLASLRPFDPAAEPQPLPPA